MRDAIKEIFIKKLCQEGCWGLIAMPWTLKNVGGIK